MGTRNLLSQGRYATESDLAKVHLRALKVAKSWERRDNIRYRVNQVYDSFRNLTYALASCFPR